MPTDLFQNPEAPISIIALLVNIGIGTVLSLILSFHFTRFGSTLSNRADLARVFPPVLLTTLLIITVVKSSLALSLGLVGALSIVRFRTPIKEPEELAYLFMAIAMGLGLGAGQAASTVVASVVILVVTAILRWRRMIERNDHLYLSIDMQLDPAEASASLEGINRVLDQHVQGSDLRRFDVREGALEATYFVSFALPDDITALVANLSGEFPSAGVTLIDQNQLPSV